jgi:CheY-like chemotaxis protein
MPALRILVVDDHADSAAALALLLKRQGHSVTTAAGVADALVAAAGMDVLDVLVADITLSDGSGCALLPLLRDRRGGPPRLAVAVTGHGDEHWVEECRRAGFDRFLLKPVVLDQLAAAITLPADVHAPALDEVPSPNAPRQQADTAQ